jgi:class 3 adenylate cyclase
VRVAADTRYVSVAGADVAYKVLSDGSVNLLCFFGLGGDVDMFSEDPRTTLLRDGLASFSRLIVFDRRGTGASGRLSTDVMPSWEDWTQDISAVMDAVGAPSAVIVAALDAGPIAMLFAAMHPDRVIGLVLANTTARFLVAEDYPIGVSPRRLDTVVETVQSLWGTAEFTRITNPVLGNDAEFRRETSQRLRASATPSDAAAQYRYLLESLDIRSLLSSIQTPTLVLHRTKNPFIPIAHGRYLAEHIRAAKFVEVPGQGIAFDDDTTAMAVDEIAEFVTGHRARLEANRVLTTILFTDIVRSTEQARTLGDRRWRRLLDTHDRAVRAEFRRFAGQEINTTGDGFCASFAQPARAIRCATAITDATRGVGTEVRAGIHTGECELRDGDLAGIAVHIAARVASLAEPGQVLVSSTVKDLVTGSELEFVDTGEHELKGLPNKWRLFAVRH